MRDENLLHKLYELQEDMTQLEYQAAVLLEENKLQEHGEKMKQHQEIYTIYWNMLQENVRDSYHKIIEGRVGHDRFTDKIYIDTLAEIMDEDNSLVDEYNGYFLKKGYDLFGCMTYWIINKEGVQIGESYDYFTDESAISSFRYMVDERYFES